MFLTAKLVARGFDCRLHRKIAHQSMLEWAVAMSPLELPAYVLEHVFNSLDGQLDKADVYQSRIGEKRIALEIAENQRKFCASAC